MSYKVYARSEGDYARRGYRAFDFASTSLSLKYSVSVSLYYSTLCLVDAEENIYILHDDSLKIRCYNTEGAMVWQSSITCYPILLHGNYIYAVNDSTNIYTIYKIDKSNGWYSSINIPSGYKGRSLNVCNDEIYILLELIEDFNQRSVLGKIIGLTIQIIQTYSHYLPWTLGIDPERNYLLIMDRNFYGDNSYAVCVDTNGVIIWTYSQWDTGDDLTKAVTDYIGRMFGIDTDTSPDRVFAVDEGNNIIFNLELDDLCIKPNGDFFGSLSGQIKSYDRNGILRWQQSGSVIVHCCNSSSVLVSGNNQLKLLSAADGSVLFDYNLGWSPVIIIPTGKGYYCLGSNMIRYYVPIFEVTVTVPVHGAIDVNPNTQISITFSDSLNTNTITASSIQIQSGAVEYTWEYNDGTKTLILIPSSSLEEGVLITVTLTDGLTSTEGISLTAYNFSFTTDMFEVISTIPLQDANNVNPDADIQITFSDSLDTSTISYDALQVYGWLPEQYEYQWTYDDGAKTLTLTIPGGLETDASIIVNLTAGLKSTNEVALTPYALGFSTAKLPLQCDSPSNY